MRMSSVASVGSGHQQAEAFLANAFQAKPALTTITEFKETKTLGGGKSGASVSRGTFRNQPAIQKLYQIRDHEDIFQTKQNMNMKAEAYRTEKQKKDKGDAVLTYIRSVRDIYLSICLQNKRSNGELLIPKLYQYGVRDNNGVQLYMIMEDISTSGFKELTKFDFKAYRNSPQNTPARKRNIDKNIKLLLRLTQALIVKHKSIQYKNESVGCHRDLHPGNVFFKETQNDYAIKFIDFDLSITSSDILNQDKRCDRKTMSGSAVKKALGNYNVTFGTYLKRNFLLNTKPLHKMFRTPLVKNDADLYMLAGYVSEFLANTETITRIQTAINTLNRFSKRSRTSSGAGSRASKASSLYEPNEAEKIKFLNVLEQNLKKEIQSTNTELKF